MAHVRYPDFETNLESYKASVAEWESVWASIELFARDLRGWTTPWLDTSLRDGNPMFSAWSPGLRRGLRVIQHADAHTFALWRNTFARGSPEAVDELVIDCAMTDEHVRRARRLINEWIRDGFESTRASPRPPLDVDLPRSDRAA